MATLPHPADCRTQQSSFEDSQAHADGKKNTYTILNHQENKQERILANAPQDLEGKRTATNLQLITDHICDNVRRGTKLF